MDGLMTTGNWSNRKVVNLADGLAAPHKLLYVARAGSYLYGTNTEASDLDFKGLFLPSEESMLLGNGPSHMKYSSGDDHSKNTSSDMDLELWSVHEWMRLLAKGDSNALGLLFSSFNTSMVLYATEEVAKMLLNYHAFYDPTNVDGFVGFAKGQAVKYGLKGHRLKLVERVLKWVRYYGDDLSEMRLGDFDLDALTEQCSFDEIKDKDYLGVVKKGDDYFLKVLTKEHQTSTRVEEFVARLEKERNKYGHRSKQAAELDGADWKALSHSLRTLLEAREMKLRGFVHYPLVLSPLLLQVKQGEVTLQEFTDVYVELEKEVTGMKCNVINNYDPVLTNNALLKLYGKEKENDANN